MMSPMEYYWTNQYIPRVRAAADKILEQTKDGFDPERLEQFNGVKQGFSKLAVEIGSGSGMHLLKQASEAPETLHVGFELRYKRTFRTIEKGEQAGLTNLFMIRGDARQIETFFKPEELSALYIHFPDPWSKNRWKKNRLLQAEYLSRLAKLLKPDATFSFRTDHPGYFADTLKLIEKMPEFVPTHTTTDLAKESFTPFRPSSEFEGLFVSKGLPICSGIFTKIAHTQPHPQP